MAFFVDMLPAGNRAASSIPSAACWWSVIAFYVAFNASRWAWLTTGQTSGSGLPLEWTFYPMGVGALLHDDFRNSDICSPPSASRTWSRSGLAATAADRRLFIVAWDFSSAPDTVPSSGTLMLLGFFITLFGGLPIGFALASGGADLHLGRRQRCPA